MKNLTITFVRHSISTKKDARKKGASADIGRVLTKKGVALADVTSLALAPDDYELMITSHVPRTVQTGLAIAANQRNLKAIIGIQELYAPIDMTKADELFALFDELPKPRQSMTSAALCEYYTMAATMLMGEIAIHDAKKIVVVNHGNVIQMLIAIIGHGQVDNVLDVELDPCDAITVLIDENGVAYNYWVVRAGETQD